MSRFILVVVILILLSAVFLKGDTLPSVADVSSAESQNDGKWIINHPDSRKIYAVQCGLDATLFVLKYFKIEYSLPRVSAGLPLSEAGISFADIQQMLEMYGLETNARKNVTLKQVAPYLNGEYLAILPLTIGNGFNHYYVGMMDDQGVVQLVNVSKGISPLVSQKSKEYNERLEKKFADAGGIVLFVKKGNGKTIPASQRVELNPSTIELGEFMIGGSESSQLIHTSFDLINTSDSPIMVSSVQTTCGCTKLEWDGGILQAGEKKEVKFAVIPGAWGRGEKTKIVRVSFADGSKLDVTLHGTGQTPVERQRIELSQYSAVIEITDESPQTELIVRLARLTSFVQPLNEITLKSNVPWLSVTMQDRDDTKKGESETAELYAKISLKEVFPLLESGDQRLACSLHVSGNKEIEPVEMKIEIFQRDFYRLSQYLVTVSKKSSETAAIQVYPEKDHDRIEILDLTAEADFIVVKSDVVDGILTILIKLDSEKEIKTGYYTVAAKMKNSNNTQNPARITINVTE